MLSALALAEAGGEGRGRGRIVVQVAEWSEGPCRVVGHVHGARRERGSRPQPCLQAPWGVGLSLCCIALCCAARTALCCAALAVSSWRELLGELTSQLLYPLLCFPLSMNGTGEYPLWYCPGWSLHKVPPSPPHTRAHAHLPVWTATWAAAGGPSAWEAPPATEQVLPPRPPQPPAAHVAPAEMMAHPL